MRFDQRHYVPCLRWKQGEYQAVLDLDATAKDFITPLIEVPEMGYDFETQSTSKSTDQHLEPFAQRVLRKWGTSPIFVDALHIPAGKTMADGRQPIIYLLDELQAHGCTAIPVTSLTRQLEYQRAVRKAINRDGLGVCLRIKIEEIVKPTLKSEINSLLTLLDLSMDDCDLILDLVAPNFEPIEGFAKLIEILIPKIPFLSKWRTFTLLGTSFPATMAEIKKSPCTILRYEWLLYKRVVTSLTKTGIRLPTFGDYGINHPDFVALDMRKLKPSASIRYTTDDGWLIIKGSNVRDNGFKQYQDHCRSVTASHEYMGPKFSQGDKYIYDCATGTAGTGNLTTWRKVGTNHHLKKVTQDVASFFGSSGVL